MTLAEKRLQVIADAAKKYADTLQAHINRGQPLGPEIMEDMAKWFDAVHIEATATDAEPQSFKVYDGLRVVS